jgi:RNA polymerase sigma-70 factor (ECF subfamily)
MTQAARSISAEAPEADLIDRARGGDREAFAALYEVYCPNVRRYIRSRLNEPSEVEDLTQETFVQAFLSIERFEGRSRLLTWLLGIARFVMLRSRRSAQRYVVGAHGGARSVADVSRDDRPERRLEAQLALARCEDVLVQACSAESRTIFELRYAADKSIREIADDVGKSTQAIRASLHRSRRVIQHRLAGGRHVASESRPDGESRSAAYVDRARSATAGRRTRRGRLVIEGPHSLGPRRSAEERTGHGAPPGSVSHRGSRQPSSMGADR